MTIIKKTTMEIHIQKFEQSYQELRQIINGTDPNPNIYDQYSLNPDDYKRDFMEINPAALTYAINACKSSLACLARLKTHKEPRRASNK